ncbi:TPA: hypothetical protein ACGO9Z_002074 [Streptococcus suis]
MTKLIDIDMTKLMDILMFSSLSCSFMYFLGAYLSGKSFDNPLTFVMLSGAVAGVLHLLDRVEEVFCH